ncbi:OsmC family protein [Ornithinimicrobium cavernae]|uniref:OsmC family protein n=1 Tax=Ornithinimicrobium cavernae TaxID=2666047 RepID=UPI000D688C9D|nr:OsmC family protein [Ornithinimicrobium cavernae]
MATTEPATTTRVESTTPRTAQVPALISERVSPATYLVRNDRGAELRIGTPGADGSFSPGELLQAAAAGCAALSAEAQLVNRLGEDFSATATVEALLNVDENRFESLRTLIEADMSQLDPEKRDRLIASAERSIDRLCTVKRSLNHGVENVTDVASRER